MLRILHILDHSLPLHSGYTFRTANVLREQHRLGWQTYQLTGPRQTGSLAAEEECDGLHFYRTLANGQLAGRLPLLKLWSEMRATERRLAGLVRELRPHILHAHSPVLNALPTLRVGQRFQLPVVYEVRAFWEDAAVDHGSTRHGSLRYRATRIVESWALRRADHVFTICEGLRTEMAARGIPNDRITVIPNAVDIGTFRLSTDRDVAFAHAVGVQGATVLGFVGSFYSYEGLDLLLDAFPRLLARCPDIRLLLVGGGPQEANLKAQAERLGIAGKVVFTGRVPHAEVNRYYDIIDLLIYPRRSMRLTELVTPLKPLEAMAQGRVLMASDVGGHRELIRDGETGRLFPAGNAQALADAAFDMLGHRERWHAMRRSGRAYVEEERNWRASVARYQEPYSRLLASREDLRPAVG